MNASRISAQTYNIPKANLYLSTESAVVTAGEQTSEINSELPVTQLAHADAVVWHPNSRNVPDRFIERTRRGFVDCWSRWRALGGFALQFVVKLEIM